jgi:hypothetical protein
MTNQSQVNSRECLQQTIGTELASLEELESIQARLRHNALLPISSLIPPEVLAAIFSLLCPPSPDTSRNPVYYPSHHRQLARLRVSHVCHQWCEIALNHPLLWSHVDFTDLSLAGTTEILIRAKSVPLYLEARLPDYDDLWDDSQYTPFRQEVQKRIPSVRHLIISAGIFYLHRTLEELVSPAPTLESLSLYSHGGYQNTGRMTGDHLVVPPTLFNGSAPRLSRLELRNCEISWRSPLLKGLTHLEMLSPPAKARPNLTAWLDALDEMPQLQTLALHSFSPIAPPFPFDVKRAAILPSLTHLELFSFPEDCALVLAHLDLPSLAVLSVTVCSHDPDMQVLLPYVTRHAYGPQDTQPLQSVLIFNDGNQAYILAWPMPDIHARVQCLSTIVAVAPPTRVALSFTCTEWFSPTIRLAVIDAAMAALPLDGLITLIVEDLTTFPEKQFWLRHSPRWPLLRRIQLAGCVLHGFTEMLLDDNGGRESPLLPSLTELVLAWNLSEDWVSALTKRMEQGVPLELLDLRLCAPHSSQVALRLPSGVAVKILGPENAPEAGEQKMVSTLAWRSIARGAVRAEVNVTSEFYLHKNNDLINEQDGSDSDGHDEDEDDEA